MAPACPFQIVQDQTGWDQFMSRFRVRPVRHMPGALLMGPFPHLGLGTPAVAAYIDIIVGEADGLTQRQPRWWASCFPKPNLG